MSETSPLSMESLEYMSSVPAGNKAHIKQELVRIAQEHDVEILFAVESGSRMWGFESPDSDYDVRFVYRSKKDSFYSSFERVGAPYKDTIQSISEDRLYDFSGWDLPKFMRHLSGMNTSVVEWCLSPIVYTNAKSHAEEPSFQEYVMEYLRDFTSVKQLWKPYQGMLFSRKCCSLENVKRAMYSARLLLVLDILDREIAPTAFTWNYLLSEASWAEPDKALLRQLRERKMANVEKYEEVPTEIKTLLECKMEALRYQSQTVAEVDEKQEREQAKQVKLLKIWKAFLA